MGIVGGIVGVNGAKTRAHVISLVSSHNHEHVRCSVSTKPSQAVSNSVEYN